MHQSLLVIAMDLRHLRYFLAVAEEGHFGRAADRLHIVQPALSMQIRALERELGTALFERTSRRVTLTEAGTLFRVEAERTLQQAARAKEVAQRAARGEVGTVRVGFVPDPAFAGKVAADVSAFKRAYPKVDLALTELPPLRQVEAVLAGQLDVGYSSFEYPKERDLAVDCIASWPWLVAMRSGHPLDKRAAITAKVLREEPFIVYAAHTADDGQVKVLRRLLKKEPRISYHVPNTFTVLTLTAAGMGLALVPASMEAVNFPNLVYRPIAELTLACNLVLLSRGSDASPAIRQFIEMARQPGRSL
jgi:DNA-binding transcriptional LysR family regulator